MNYEFQNGFGRLDYGLIIAVFLDADVVILLIVGEPTLRGDVRTLKLTLRWF